MKQNNYYQKGFFILLSFLVTSLAVKAQTYIQDGIEYTLVGEEYSVTGYNASANTDLVIPATTNDGKKVTSIGISAFDGWKALQSVSLPVNIKSIGNYAFRGCTGLTEVQIPEGVTILDRWSFANCSNLKTIGLPSTLMTMNGNVFYNCIGLEKITLPINLASIGNSVFSGCTGLKEITFMGDCPEVASGTFFSVGTVEEPTRIMVKESYLTNYMAKMSGNGSSYQWASGGVLTLMSEIDGIIYAYVAGTTAHFSVAGMGTVTALADGT